MSHLRLMMVGLFSVLCCTAWADGLRMPDEHGVEPVRHQEKFAGRASTLASETDPQNKFRNTPASERALEAHEKKPLSKEEKRALRRQINETENKYPRKN